MQNQIVNNDNPFTDQNQIVASPKAQPIVWRDFAKQLGIAGTPISAKELVGTEIDILRAKRFDSSFPGQDHAWYCVVRPVGNEELFSVVLGGGAVVEILDAFAMAGCEQPIRCTIGWKDGGKFNGYYTLE